VFELSNHTFIVSNLLSWRSKSFINDINLSRVNRKLGLHPDLFQVDQFSSQSFNVFEFHIWCVNADHSLSMAIESEVLASEIKFFTCFGAMDFKVCGEIISTESCSNKSAFAGF